MMKIFAAVIVLCVGVTTSTSEPQQGHESYTNLSVPVSTTTELPDEDDVKKTPVTSSSEVLYGESDAEQLGELSVIDVLFRKRRNLDGRGDNSEAEIATDKTDHPPVLVEEIEFFYEEISSDDEDSMVNVTSTTSTTEQSPPLAKAENKNGPALKTYLIPPSEDNLQQTMYK